MISTKASQVRSLEENKYYWGVVIHEIAGFKRWRPDQAHEWVKITWNIESTTVLTTKEYEELLGAVREHCLRFWGLEINLPNQ